MCRRDQLWGCILIAFGLGLLIGIWIEGGFLSKCFAIGIGILGLCVIRRS